MAQGEGLHFRGRAASPAPPTQAPETLKSGRKRRAGSGLLGLLAIGMFLLAVVRPKALGVLCNLTGCQRRSHMHVRSRCSCPPFPVWLMLHCLHTADCIWPLEGLGGA